MFAVAPEQTEPATRELGRRRFIVGALALLSSAVLLLGAGSVRLGINHWAPFGTGSGVRISADGKGAGADLGSLADEVETVGEVTSHWDGTGRWGLRSPSGDLVASIRSVRLVDDDPTADYYVAELATTWTHGTGTTHLPNPVEITVTSDSDALDRVYGGTASFVSEAGCDVTLSLPATNGGWPGGLNGGSARVCPGYGIDLVDIQPRTATWRIVQPEGLRYVDLEFAEKVPQGVVPRWIVTVLAEGGTETFSAVR